MKPFAIAICALFTASLAGQTAQSKKPILGAGTTSCSEWKSVEVRPGTFSSSRHDPVQVSWILGYVSATGALGRSPEYIEGYIAGACQANPAQTLGAATEALVQFLKTHNADGRPLN